MNVELLELLERHPFGLGRLNPRVAASPSPQADEKDQVSYELQQTRDVLKSTQDKLALMQNNYNTSNGAHNQVLPSGRGGEGEHLCARVHVSAPARIVDIGAHPSCCCFLVLLCC